MHYDKRKNTHYMELSTEAICEVLCGGPQQINSKRDKSHEAKEKTDSEKDVTLLLLNEFLFMHFKTLQAILEKASSYTRSFQILEKTVK